MITHLKKLLRPKHIGLCAGCPKKLELTRVFDYDIPEPTEKKKEAGKVVTLKDIQKKKKGSKITSLF